MGPRNFIKSRKAVEKERLSGCCPPKPHIRGLQDAGEKLVNFIFPQNGSCRENKLQRLIVILAFDEADQLASPVHDGSSLYWTILSELRHVLHELHKLPILTLFISTAVAKLLYSPNPNDTQGLHPAIETSTIGTNLDALAYSAEEWVTTLDEVAQDKWMCHLGRPLFASLPLVYPLNKFTYYLEQFCRQLSFLGSNWRSKSRSARSEIRWIEA